MAKSVTIYSTPTCGFCYMAKEYFKRNDIKYIEKDVSLDRTAVEEMVNKSGQLGVPVIDIDGEIVVGFNQPKLAELLK
jgi:glutaredoxin 3